MNFREYTPSDEKEWVRCRVLSFLDSSYYDDVRTTKETYEHPSVCLVAECGGHLIGFIDIEYERTAGDVCYLKGGLGAAIWHLGVLPEYRRQGVARKLWHMAKNMLNELGIHRFEVWTQDDKASCGWYEQNGFQLKEAYLNAFIRGSLEDDAVAGMLNLNSMGNIYGIRCLNFEAPIERKAELEKVCYRLHEVRVYELS